jgi:hypothetical protein
VFGMPGNRVCRTINVADQAACAASCRASTSRCASTPVSPPARSSPSATRAAITGGPFMGVEGRVVACNEQKAMVALSVTVLGQGTVLEIDANLVERL